MRVVNTLLMIGTCALCIPGAHAQTLNFTNDFSHIKGENADPALRQNQTETAHFPAGSAVWAVLDTSTTNYASVHEFAESLPQGVGLRKVVEMANRSGGWDLVSSGELPLPPGGGTGKAMSFSIIPDKPNGTQEFNQLLSMIAAHKGPDPILIRVRIENGFVSRQFTQNGFYLDIADGLGRYGDWLAQRGASANAANASFEQQHLGPRTAFVDNYRSLKADPKFVADVRKWWSDKVGGPLLSAKVCSADTIIMRNDLGIVTEKQLCALVTYKSGNQCFAMMRRFSYRRVGRDTFDNDLVDATYADQSLPADPGESFSGAHPYEIECTAKK